VEASERQTKVERYVLPEANLTEEEREREREREREKKSMIKLTMQVCLCFEAKL
jgi:hypothetical protein